MFESYLLDRFAWRGVAGPKRLGERVMDLRLTCAVLPCVSLLMLLVAALITLGSRGPVLYEQEWTGKASPPFALFKPRTKVANADQVLDELVDLDASEELAFKIQDDPSITRVGRLFLRR